MSIDPANDAIRLPFEDGYDALQWCYTVTNRQGKERKVPADVCISQPKLFAEITNNLVDWAVDRHNELARYSNKLIGKEEAAGKATDTETHEIINDLYEGFEKLIKHLETDKVSYGTPENDVDVYSDLSAYTGIIESIFSILERVKENAPAGTELGKVVERVEKYFPQSSYLEFGKLLDRVSQPSITSEDTIIAKDLRRVLMKQWGKVLDRRVEAEIDRQSGLLNGPSTYLVSAEDCNDSVMSVPLAQSLYERQGGSGASAVSR